MKKFSYSLCTAKESLQKTLSLDKETRELKKRSPAFFPNSFKAIRKETDFRGLMRILENADENQFLIHGVSVHDKAKVVTKDKKESTYKENHNVIARSGKYFKYPTGEPGLFMIDVDDDQYDLDTIIEMLIEIYPDFATAGYVANQSSSSSIVFRDKYLSGQKWHIYFVAKEGQDIERFGKVLFERAILAGYGRIFISVDGKQHIRTFFDLSVIAPYRIDFISQPIVKSPLTRMTQDPTYEEGRFLETLKLRDLLTAQQREYKQITGDLKDDTKDEAIQVRVQHIEDRVGDYMQATGSDYHSAKTVVQARYVDAEEVRLHYKDLITFEDGDEETVFVKDIVSEVEDYIGRSVSDPLEPDYGEGKAKLYLSSGRILINSFVHGGRKFILSGNSTKQYDTDSNARLIGFRLDADAINGGWADKMLENWSRINDGGRVRYARLTREMNKYIPIPEKGESVSSLIGLDPLLMFDERNFLQAMPKVPVITGWDVKENEPIEEYLGHAFLKLPNIDFKEGGVTMIEPSEEVDKIFLNKWIGFPVAPVRGKIHKVIDQYFEEFIEWENEDVYEYFWAYIYHMFQHPFEKPGVAMLFQSTQGTGKGTFIQMLSSLIGPTHSAFIGRIESITGRFNSIIAGKLLIYADEIMFGGYHEANQILKKIITDEYLTVEEKFQAQQMIANVSRLFFSTNESWALNIERDDRRLFVPRISTTFQKDIEFFTELRYQWNRHYEHVMNRFMTMPINVELSVPPMTRDKLELIDVSMHSAEAMFKEALIGGILESPEGDFHDPIAFKERESTGIKIDVLYSIYCVYHKKNYARQGEPLNNKMFWKELYSFFGGKEASGITMSGRIGTDKRKALFPPIERMRLLWDESHDSNDFEEL